MKSFISFILGIICIVPITIKSQVGIGTNTPHNKSVLDIKSGKNKGVIIGKSQNLETLPLYDKSQSDFYQDDPSMEGMIIYVISEKEVYLYDGKKWIPAGTIQSNYNPNITRIGTSKSKTAVCIINICGSPSLEFNRVNDPNLYFSDGLGITQGRTDNTYVEIKEDGFYRISPSIAVDGGGVSLLGSKISLQILGNLLTEDNRYRGNQVLGRSSLNTIGLLLEIGTSLDINFSQIQYLQKGDRISIEFDVDASGISLGSGFSNETYYDRTYLTIEKLQ